MAEKNITAITTTIITNNEDLRKVLKPGANSIEKRLEAMKVLSQEGGYS